MDANSFSPPVQRLFAIGKAVVHSPWADRNPDYVAAFGLTRDHIPELLLLAKDWADDDRAWDDDGTGCAPIYGWRALGQLGALEAVEPLLSMMDHLDQANDDDWYLEEFPLVFGLVGPRAISQLSAYLSHVAHQECPRIAASHGLQEIAKRHPEARAEVVEILTAQLQKREHEQYALNAALIYDLVSLGADESAEAIERAFSAGVVDEGYMGNWERVRDELGVEGLGLPQPANPYNSLAGFRESLSRIRAASQQDDRRRKKKKLAAKLKQARKKRK
jgi:hypothetical protein